MILIKIIFIKWNYLVKISIWKVTREYENKIFLIRKWITKKKIHTNIDDNHKLIALQPCQINFYIYICVWLVTPPISLSMSIYRSFLHITEIDNHYKQIFAFVWQILIIYKTLWIVGYQEVMLMDITFQLTWNVYTLSLVYGYICFV